MIGHTYYHLWNGSALTTTSMIGHTYYHMWKGTVLTSTSMVGHTYYHLWKGSALTITSMVGHTYYHLWKGSTLTITSIVGHTYYHLWKGSALRVTSMIGHTYYHLWKGTSLTSIQAGPHLAHSDGRAYAHIWSWGNTSQQLYQNVPQSSTKLHGNWSGASILLENGSCPYIWPTCRNGQHPHLTWKELNPLAMK